MPPRILFLKQTTSTVGAHHWFIELGLDLARQLGPCHMYTDVPTDRQTDGLTLLAAPAYSKKTTGHRLWSWWRYFVGATWLVFRSAPETLLFIVAQPPYLPLLGWLKNVIWRQRYVVWVDDIYPDVIVRHGKLGERHPIVRLWQWFNRVVFSRAEKIFTLGPYMAQVLRPYVRDPATRLQIVPTWVDTGAIQPLAKEKNPFAQAHGQVGKFTVLYSGNLGLSHDLKTMVAAARRLQDRPAIHFMVIGAGPQWPKLAEAARELPNFTLLPYQPAEQLPYSLTTGEVAVISLDRGMEGVSLPSKSQFMLAAGAALLGLSRRPSDLQMLIEQYACGLNVEPGDVAGFCQAVLRFYEAPEFLQACRQAARRAAEAEFSRAVNVQRVYQAIESRRHATVAD